MLEAKEAPMKAYLENEKLGSLNDVYTRFMNAEARYNDKEMWRTSPDSCIEAFQEMIQLSTEFLQARQTLRDSYIPFIFDPAKGEYIKTPLPPQSP
jgi:hypothetical protein